MQHSSTCCLLSVALFGLVVETAAVAAAGLVSVLSIVTLRPLVAGAGSEKLPKLSTVMSCAGG